jgi:hypothetical protein
VHHSIVCFCLGNSEYHWNSEWYWIPWILLGAECYYVTMLQVYTILATILPASSQLCDGRLIESCSSGSSFILSDTRFKVSWDSPLVFVEGHIFGDIFSVAFWSVQSKLAKWDGGVSSCCSYPLTYRRPKAWAPSTWHATRACERTHGTVVDCCATKSPGRSPPWVYCDGVAPLVKPMKPSEINCRDEVVGS